MSQISESNAVAEVLVGLVNETAYLYGKDLDATPDDLCSGCDAEKGRSILAFTAETIGFNFLIASHIAGTPKSFPSEDERAEIAAKFGSKAAAKAGLEESVNALTAAIQSVEASDWMTKVTAPWGAEVTKAHLASWAALHTMYHDGQMNLIQVQNGDTEVHWM
jgi:hypothetical protein